MRLLAIDPGDVHVGMAVFDGPLCTDAWEATPAESVVYVSDCQAAYDVLVIEEFRLYPWRAQAQSFSQMQTCELIGQLRLAYQQRKQIEWPIGAKQSADGTGVMQSAQIKEPTTHILRARMVPSRAKQSKAGSHAFDAELHGHYYLEHQRADGLTIAEATKKVGRR